MITAIIINAHAEIVLISFGLAPIHKISLLANIAYPTKEAKSKIT